MPTQYQKDMLDVAIARLDVKDPGFNASSKIRAAFSDPDVVLYLQTWVISSLEQLRDGDVPRWKRESSEREAAHVRNARHRAAQRTTLSMEPSAVGQRVMLRGGYINVVPRYSPGSPAYIPAATAAGVAQDEVDTYARALEGRYGEEFQQIAREVGLRGIVYSRDSVRGKTTYLDLITGEVYATDPRPDVERAIKLIGEKYRGVAP